MDCAQNRYVVVYAKIATDKADSIYLQGVYFGGLGSTDIEATTIARECVNNIKGGTILPNIVKLDNEETIIDAMYTAADKFEKVTNDMKEADQILSKQYKRKR